MKFSIFSVLILAGSAFALTEKATYDPVYDNPANSLNIVSCSNLVSQFPTFGSVPTFPNIGGAFVVTGFASPGCGTCWKLSANGSTIYFTAIDHAGDGFNLSEESLNVLTDGQAVRLGFAEVYAEEVDKSYCGI